MNELSLIEKYALNIVKVLREPPVVEKMEKFLEKSKVQLNIYSENLSFFSTLVKEMEGTLVQREIQKSIAEDALKELHEVKGSINETRRVIKMVPNFVSEIVAEVSETLRRELESQKQNTRKKINTMWKEKCDISDLLNATTIELEQLREKRKKEKDIDVGAKIRTSKAIEKVQNGVISLKKSLIRGKEDFRTLAEEFSGNLMNFTSLLNEDFTRTSSEHKSEKEGFLKEISCLKKENEQLKVSEEQNKIIFTDFGRLSRQLDQYTKTNALLEKKIGNIEETGRKEASLLLDRIKELETTNKILESKNEDLSSGLHERIAESSQIPPYSKEISTLGNSHSSQTEIDRKESDTVRMANEIIRLKDTIRGLELRRDGSFTEEISGVPSQEARNEHEFGKENESIFGSQSQLRTWENGSSLSNEVHSEKATAVDSSQRRTNDTYSKKVKIIKHAPEKRPNSEESNIHFSNSGSNSQKSPFLNQQESSIEAYRSGLRGRVERDSSLRSTIAERTPSNRKSVTRRRGKRIVLL